MLKDLLKKYKLTQTEFSRRFDIPLRTVQNWVAGARVPPDYVLKLVEFRLEKESNL